jgi:CheY-like chemotaxis protein
MTQAPDPARKARRILVVEDNADTAASSAKLLELFGHEARIARDGPGAIDAAAAWRPDVILLDLGLPGMDGYEVAARLRASDSCRHAVIIAVTGHGLPEARERSRVAGIDHHLLKPVDLGELLSLLNRPGSPPQPVAVGLGGPGPPRSSGAGPWPSASGGLDRPILSAYAPDHRPA